MKTTGRVSATCCFLAMSFRLIAEPFETVEPAVRLTGLLTVRGTSKVCFLVQQASERSPPRVMLEENQLSYGVAVEKIDARAGSVKVRIHGTEKTLTLALAGIEPAALPAAAPENETEPRDCYLALADMPLEQALDVYALLGRRTILRSSNLQDATFKLKTPDLLSAARAAQILGTAFSKRGISLLPHGDKFVVAVPAEIEERVQRTLPPKPVADKKDELAVGAGMLQVENVPLSQFLEIYEMISGRKVANRGSFRPAPALDRGVTLKTQQSLTTAETVYACEAVLALNGIKVVPLSEKEVQVVPFIAPQE